MSYQAKRHIVPAQPGWYRLEWTKRESWAAEKVIRHPIVAWGVDDDGGDTLLAMAPVTAGVVAVFEEGCAATETPDGLVYDDDIGVYPSRQAWMLWMEECDRAKEQETQQ